MFTLVAPVDDNTIFCELKLPVTKAVGASLILRVPEATPLVCVKVAVVPNVIPSLDTWNPVGAVAIRFEVRLLPEIAKLWVDEGEPYVVVNADVVAAPNIIGVVVAVKLTLSSPNP